jgi:hypothetical protein
MANGCLASIFQLIGEAAQHVSLEAYLTVISVISLGQWLTLGVLIWKGGSWCTRVTMRLDRLEEGRLTRAKP